MAGLLVDVQLEILVVVHETPTDLVDSQMERILNEKNVDFSKLVVKVFTPPGRPSGSNHDG